MAVERWLLLASPSVLLPKWEPQMAHQHRDVIASSRLAVGIWPM